MRASFRAHFSPPFMRMSIPHIGVICDFLEENWPSMDLVADMLLERLAGEYNSLVTAVRIRPTMSQRFMRLPRFGRSRLAFNADRLINRTWDYLRLMRKVAPAFDV